MNVRTYMVGAVLFCAVCHQEICRLEQHQHDSVTAKAAEQMPLPETHREYSTDPVIAPPVAAVTSSTAVPASAWMAAQQVNYRRASGYGTAMSPPSVALLASATSSVASTSLSSASNG